MPVFFEPRKVRLTKEIVHRDREGNLLGRWPVGSVITVTFDAGHYWIGRPDVYKDEGVLLDGEVDERFIQLSNN